jgi:hypothetical protein
VHPLNVFLMVFFIVVGCATELTHDFPAVRFSLGVFSGRFALLDYILVHTVGVPGVFCQRHVD